MRKTVFAAAMAAAFSLPSLVLAQAAPAAAEASAPTVTGNLSFVSDYRFRGISQTYGLPAVQGGFDYAHASGAYLGTWASNVYSTASNGIGTSYTNGASLEWDFYGGYKFEAAKDLALDVGALYYYYPGAHWNNTDRTSFDNLELYIAASYKWFSVKYSHALTDYFGAKTATLGGVCGIEADGTTATSNCFGAAPGSSKGSSYLDLNANFEVSDKLVLGLHAGHATVQNYSLLDYSDYKVSLSKEFQGFNLGIAAVGTDAKRNVYRTTTGTTTAPTGTYDTSAPTLVLSVSKTF
jgi:uncharacterized protein (TIGR02001 family)